MRVPDGVRQKALAGGEECRRWLSSLDSLVGGLVSEWGLGSVGEPYERGTTSLVVPVVSSDGTQAVLKVAMPAEREGLEDLRLEAAVLRLAGGRGCVRLLRYDELRGAMLLERLGLQLFQLGVPRREEYEIIYATVRELWTVPCAGALPTGADKARWLGDYVAQSWSSLGRPCSRLVVDIAASYAQRRASAFDASSAVLVHGDAHAWNTLEDPSSVGGRGFRLVDPDGLLGEPEYDMAISMREYPDELLAGDALALGRERLRFLARLSGLDEEKIWEWGFLEVASSGLLHLSVGNVSSARSFLAVGEAWAGAGA